MAGVYSAVIASVTSIVLVAVAMYIGKRYAQRLGEFDATTLSSASGGEHVDFDLSNPASEYNIQRVIEKVLKRHPKVRERLMLGGHERSSREWLPPSVSDRIVVFYPNLMFIRGAPRKEHMVETLIQNHYKNEECTTCIVQKETMDRLSIVYIDKTSAAIDALADADKRWGMKDPRIMNSALQRIFGGGYLVRSHVIKRFGRNRQETLNLEKLFDARMPITVELDVPTGMQSHSSSSTDQHTSSVSSSNALTAEVDDNSVGRFTCD